LQLRQSPLYRPLAAFNGARQPAAVHPLGLMEVEPHQQRHDSLGYRRHLAVLAGLRPALLLQSNSGDMLNFSTSNFAL
jgi:hypothetical protein